MEPPTQLQLKIPCLPLFFSHGTCSVMPPVLSHPYPSPKKIQDCWFIKVCICKILGGVFIREGVFNRVLKYRSVWKLMQQLGHTWEQTEYKTMQKLSTNTFVYVCTCTVVKLNWEYVCAYYTLLSHSCIDKKFLQNTRNSFGTALIDVMCKMCSNLDIMK